MSQGEILDALDGILGQEVVYVEYAGAKPVRGVLKKQEKWRGAPYYEVSEGENKVEFYYVEVEVMTAKESSTNENIIFGWPAAVPL